MGGAHGSAGGDTGIGSWLPRVFNPQKWIPDLTGQREKEGAIKATALANADQAHRAGELQTQLLQQPKQVSPDNFLATKAKELANLRLGLASTITGGGAGGAVLSSPSLTGNGPGKVKLGQ